MKNHNYFKVLLLTTVIGFNACSNWLDVVPEGVATIDMAFNSRTQAIKYLATCYSFMLRDGDLSNDPAILGGDEMWTNIHPVWGTFNPYYIAMGRQNAASPINDGWGWIYPGIRECNSFLENIAKVPDLPPWERDLWIAEVMVLKAYYHFCLIQRYGPITIVRENVPISSSVSSVRGEREPMDECFQYVVELLDEVLNNDKLQLVIADPATDMGRITKPIAASLKAKVLLTAASPLFNGNNDQATLRNPDGTPLFNTVYDPSKWEKALVACKAAIEICHEANMELYQFQNRGSVRYVTDTLLTQLSLRNAFTERWNSEIIWANSQSLSGSIQSLSKPLLNIEWNASWTLRYVLGMPLKIASMFYSDHGVPLSEDKTRDVSKLYNLRTATVKDRLYIREGRTTVDMHFDREPRFYAWCGFDGGIWHGAGRYDESNPNGLWYLGLKGGETDGDRGMGFHSGYMPKKYIFYENQVTGINTYSYTNYPWPIMRLSDLYLMLAEVINEVEGPNGPNSNEMFKYIDMIRARAGLKGVKESWNTYSINPTKYNNQVGMRQIIQMERMIELCFEGHRFWDIRRWKTAPEQYRTPIEGWNTKVSVTHGTESEVNQMFYTPQVIFKQEFRTRDYFWPLRDSELNKNPNLVQNIGW